MHTPQGEKSADESWQRGTSSRPPQDPLRGLACVTRGEGSRVFGVQSSTPSWVPVVSEDASSAHEMICLQVTRLSRAGGNTREGV